MAPGQTSDGRGGDSSVDRRAYPLALSPQFLPQRPTTSAVRRTIIADPDWDVYTERAFYASAAYEATPPGLLLLQLLVMCSRRARTNYPLQSDQWRDGGACPSSVNHIDNVDAHTDASWKANLSVLRDSIGTCTLTYPSSQLQPGCGRQSGQHASQCMYTRSSRRRSVGTSCTKTGRRWAHTIIIFIKNALAMHATRLQRSSQAVFIQLTAFVLCPSPKLIYTLSTISNHASRQQVG